MAKSPLQTDIQSMEIVLKQDYIIIAVNDQWFGIDVEYVVELIEQPQPQFIPNTPEYIAGVINYRGDILSAINFEAALYGDTKSRHPRTSQQVGIILNINTEKYCFLVSEILGVYFINEDDFTTEFPYIPGLQTNSSINAIALAPLNNPEKKEIIEFINPEDLLTNCYNRWIETTIYDPSEKSASIRLLKPIDEEITNFDLIHDSDSYFEQQEKMKQLKLHEIFLIQIGLFYFGIPLKFIQRVFPSSVIRKYDNSSRIVIGELSYDDIRIPVIDIRDILFTDLTPPIVESYSVFIINSEHLTFAIVADSLQGVTKASIAEKSDFQEIISKKQYEQINHSLVDRIGSAEFEENLDPFPILHISNIVKLLKKNSNVNTILAKLTEQNINDGKAVKDLNIENQGKFDNKNM